MELRLVAAYCDLGRTQRDGLHKDNNETGKYEDARKNLKDASKNFRAAKEILKKRLEKTELSDGDRRDELSLRLAETYCDIGKTYEQQLLTNDQVIGQYRLALENYPGYYDDASKSLSDLALRQKDKEEQKDEEDKDFLTVVKTFRGVLKVLSAYADNPEHTYKLRRNLLACYCMIKDKDEKQYEVAKDIYRCKSIILTGSKGIAIIKS